jgi:hypothetical protein
LSAATAEVEAHSGSTGERGDGGEQECREGEHSRAAGHEVMCERIGDDPGIAFRNHDQFAIGRVLVAIVHAAGRPVIDGGLRAGAIGDELDDHSAARGRDRHLPTGAGATELGGGVKTSGPEGGRTDGDHEGHADDDVNRDAG